MCYTRTAANPDHSLPFVGELRTPPATLYTRTRRFGRGRAGVFFFCRFRYHAIRASNTTQSKRHHGGTHEVAHIQA